MFRFIRVLSIAVFVAASRPGNRACIAWACPRAHYVAKVLLRLRSFSKRKR